MSSKKPSAAMPPRTGPGAPPKPAAQVMTPAAAAKSPPEDKARLLADPAMRGTPAASAKQEPRGMMVRSDAPEEEHTKDVVNVRLTNTTCCSIMTLVLMLMSFGFGYYFREHQTDEAKERVSELENLILAEVVKDKDAIIDQLQHTQLIIDLEERLAQTAPDAQVCLDGLLIGGPMPTLGNTILYGCLLVWTFLGVAVFADLFMVAIEQICATEVVQKVQVGEGKTRTLTSKVWNPTIANLSLMALGSSAPEILLSVIEIFGNRFYAGELGPSTIVGSAAFNMLVISAVCVMAIPEGEGRLIQERSVFYITASFSVFAYAWLIVILSINTPNIVDIWEGVATFIYFPILIWLAYLADQGKLGLLCACFSCLMPKQTLVSPAKAKGVRRSSVAESDFDQKGAGARAQHMSKAYYRISATRSMTGARSIEEVQADAVDSVTSVKLHDEPYTDLNFVSSSVAIHSGDEQARAVIYRSGNLKMSTSVSYVVRSSARAAAHEMTTNVVTFEPQQQTATILVDLLESDLAVKKDGSPAFEIVLSKPVGGRLGPRARCSVKAVTNAGPGTLILAEDHISVKEEDRKVVLTVRRTNGSDGTISCTVNTKDNTAVAPADYIAVEDETLTFGPGVLEQSIEITIIEDDQYEGDEVFNVIFSDATSGASFSTDCDGGPNRAIATVTIVGDPNGGGCPSSCTELAVRAGFNVDDFKLSIALWSQQFEEACTFEKDSGCIGFIMFLLSLPWKLAVAFAPPPRIMGGWACFFATLVLIGGLTALIGDLAAHLGCCMGISKSITAITFVALGTSLPDTFASYTAATSEDNADASIGNVTGSNSVNVFLGIGLPWAIAAIYWTKMASSESHEAWHATYSSESWYVAGMTPGFAVPAGNLGFSVGVFTSCALLCLGTLMGRRATIGYELGMALRLPTAIFFVLLWFVYIGASIWKESN